LGAKVWICWIHRRPTTYVTAEIRPPDVTLLLILPYAVDPSHRGRERLGRRPVDWGSRMVGGSKVAAESQGVPVPFSGVRTSPILLNWEASLFDGVHPAVDMQDFTRRHGQEVTEERDTAAGDHIGVVDVPAEGGTIGPGVFEG
jgi:hypothetical protein